MSSDQEDIEVVSSETTEMTSATEAYWTENVMEMAQPIEATFEEEQMLAQMAAEPWTQPGAKIEMESVPPQGTNVLDYQDIVDTPNDYVTTQVPWNNLSNMPSVPLERCS